MPPEAGSAYQVGVAGLGNLGTHLAQAVTGVQGFSLAAVFSRRSAGAVQEVLPGVPLQSFPVSAHLKALDILLLTLADDAIEPYARALGELAAKSDSSASDLPMLVHCSGSQSIALLQGAAPQFNAGVFYPLQTFTVGAPVDWPKVPVFLETPNTPTASDSPLAHLAEALRCNWQPLTSEERQRLHLGAVFASNFVNALVAESDELLQAVQGLDYRIYLPLLRQVVEKLERLPPAEAQTGPASRGDKGVLQRHEHLLSATDPKLLELYRLLTERIQKKA